MHIYHDQKHVALLLTCMSRRTEYTRAPKIDATSTWDGYSCLLATTPLGYRRRHCSPAAADLDSAARVWGRDEREESRERSEMAVNASQFAHRICTLVSRGKMVSSPARSHMSDLSDVTNRIEGGRNGIGDKKV